MKVVYVMSLLLLVSGCGVYDATTKGLARAVSPEYRAYEAQQAAQQRAIEERKACEKSRC